MRRLTLLALGIYIIFSACAKKTKSRSNPGYMPSPLSQDAVPVIGRIATKPDGGAVLGKVQGIDPEEVERRKLRNISQAIVFGETAAGISMLTTALEARKILATAASSAQGFEIYPEHIRIAWKGDETSTPDYLIIDNGYAGKMELPLPYGALQVGQSLVSVIKNQADLKAMLLNLGISFEKQISSYDCEKSLTCRLTESANFFSLEYRRGGLLIAKQPELPLSFIYFNGPNRFYPRPTDPMVYGISIAGVTFQSKRAGVEARIGPPESSSGEILYYDRQSVGIIWGADATPSIMQALGSYQGSLNFGVTIGARKIQDSFASYAPENDDGTLLMQNIYRGISNTEVDCKTLIVPCTLIIDAPNNRITMNMERSAFVFTNSADRTWLLYGTREP